MSTPLLETIITLTTLSLVTAVTSSEISCYKARPSSAEYWETGTHSDDQYNETWSNSTLLQTITSVPVYEECQLVCQVTKTTLLYLVQRIQTGHYLMCWLDLSAVTTELTAIIFASFDQSIPLVASVTSLVSSYMKVGKNNSTLELLKSVRVLPQ